MKALLSISAVLVLTVGSLLISVQAADKRPAELPIPSELSVLENQLDKVNYDLNDRNTRLRLQRAQYYYQSSVKLLDSGWKAKALEHAQRGLNLLALQGTQTTGAPVVSF